MPRIPWALQSYKHRNLPISAQQIINWFAEQEPRDAASPVVLLPTPGVTEFTSVTSGVFRGMRVFRSSLFVVSGTTLYEVEVDGSVTARGTVDGITPVDMDDNGVQIGICCPDLAFLYYYDPATLTVTQVTDTDFEGAVSLACIGGRAVCVRPDSDTFAWSAIHDMSDWGALDFASAEAASDNIVRGKRVNEQLWLFGERTTEVWSLTSDPNAPFQRLNGAFIERGIAARFSFATRLSVPFWIGDDRVVYRGDGVTPTRISTHAIEQVISGYGSVSDARAFIYEQEGHVFYCLTFPSGGDTWVYDQITQSWHERESEGADYGGAWRVIDATAFGGAVIGADLVDQRLYVIDPTVSTEDGDLIIRVAAGAPLLAEGRRLYFPLIEADMQTGVGLTSGQGSAPLVWMNFSDDGGRTWSNNKYASLGAIGDYRARVRWLRNGEGRERVFRLQMSDPVATALIAANITYEPAQH